MAYGAGLFSGGMIVLFVLEGPINHRVFGMHVERVMVLEAKPSTIVIIDNLSSREGSAANRSARSLGRQPSISRRTRPT